MKKNNLVVAMATAALAASMGAMADNFDTFTASFTVDDDITINGLVDVPLSAADLGSDGHARKRTPFCVGRTVGDGSPLGFEITVRTDNPLDGSAYALRQGGSASGTPMPYKLHRSTADAFDGSIEITSTGNTFTGTTTQSVAVCDSAGRADNGYIWVSIASADMEGASGDYSDLVTLTVAVN